MFVISSLSYLCLSKALNYTLYFMAKFQVVKETINGKLIYPNDLPKDRGCLAQLCAGYCSLILFSGSGFLAHGASLSIRDTLIFIGVATTSIISGIFILHLAIKTFTFVEDYQHLHTRHHDSLVELALKAYSFNIPSLLLGGFGLVLAPWAWHLYGFEYMFKYGYKPLLPIVSASFFLQWAVRMSWSHLEDSIRVEDMNGMDYGSGMAYSFFYGFLRIVLPVTGDENKGIQERIDMFIAKEGLKEEQFPAKKLFILIPSSKFIPCSLHELSEGWMLPSKSLEEQKFHIAGVRSRSYKNTVYKIRDPSDEQGEYVYVVAEGATPLRTLHEVVSHNSKKSEFYRAHQKEIIHMFFITLRDILRSDERTKNNCELIYYIDDDEHGDKINIAKLILERIRELKEKKAEKRRLSSDT